MPDPLKAEEGLVSSRTSSCDSGMQLAAKFIATSLVRHMHPARSKNR